MKNLVDWKLEFKSSVLAKEFEKEYNDSAFRLTRITTIISGLGAFLLPFCQYVTTHQKLSDFQLYCGVYLIFIWCTAWTPGLIFLKKFQQYGGLVGAMIFGGLTIITNTTNIVSRNNYLYDAHGSTPGLFFLVQITIIRLNCKHFIPCGIISLIMSCVVAGTAPGLSTRERFGNMIPNMLYAIICLYVGYKLEKWWKYDFFQRKLADSQAAKLDWTAARDASLLRNIFPKNISDELEMQMSTLGSGNNSPKHPKLVMFQKRSSGNLQSVTNSNRSSAQSLKPNTRGSKNDVVPIARTSISSHRRTSISTNNSLRTARADLTTILGLSTDSINSEHFNSNNINGMTFSTVLNTDNMVNGFRRSGELLRPPTKTKRKSFGSLPPLSVAIPIPMDDFTPRISPTNPIVIPPIVTATPTLMAGPSDLDHPFGMKRVITTSGTPLNTPNHKPELHMFLTGAQHSDGSRIALSHSYPHVCVIFSDIVGFTNLSSLISPKELVTLLNDLFTKFDNIMEAHNLEKIRTIGDAYLCVANMSIPIENPEEICVCVALEMIAAVRTINESISLRVGIASGPLIAGVTGTMKWNYDIFGKPFTEANHMEALAPPNCAAVTETFFLTSEHKDVFTPHKSDDGTNFYVVGVEKLSSIPTAMSSPKDTYSSTEDNVGLLAHPKLSDVDEEVLDYVDVVPDLLEAETELQLDLSSKFGFSREALEYEMRVLQNRKVYFNFTQPEFEQEYYKVTMSSVNNYVKYYCIVLGIFQIIFLLVDMAVEKVSHLHVSSLIVFPISTAIFFSYALFSAFLGNKNHKVTSVVAFLTATSYALSFLLAYKTVLHITWTMNSVLILTGFIRVPSYLMLIGEVIITITLTAVVTLTNEDIDFPVHYTIIMFAFVVVSSYSLTAIQKSFRGRFLAFKKLKYDMYQQKIAQHRSKLLLHNILHAEIIPRLHNTDENSAGVVDLFEQATIMFVNITNLEEITQKEIQVTRFKCTTTCLLFLMRPLTLMVWRKLKQNHTDVAIKLAVEFYNIAKNYSFPLIEEQVHIRVGIASGPVIAGIIGKKKYSYDCWSDTVNTASRMESSGWFGCLQVDPQAYELSSFRRHFTKRERLNIKGKGLMDAYILELAKFVK